MSDHPREPGSKGIVVEMGDSKILFNYVQDFGDSFVSIYFVLRQFRTHDSLGHDTVGDLVQAEEVSIGFSKISFVCIYFLDGIIGMTASGDAKRNVTIRSCG